ncbi:MAG: response regulator [Blautia sp.]|nr:response regulator [Blautia sp.]
MRKLSVVIADDDRIVLKDLRNMVNWSELGFSIAATAVSGEEAYRCVEQYQPFLLITDIRMLGDLTGLDVIEQARRKFPRMKFLVISSYDDFHYLKRAMASGVIDYLLKTDITPATLTQKLLEARDQLSLDSVNTASVLNHEIAQYLLSDKEETIPETGLPHERNSRLADILEQPYYFMLCGQRLLFSRDQAAAISEMKQKTSDMLSDVYQNALNYDVFPIVCQYNEMLLVGLSASMTTRFSLKDFSNSLLYLFGGPSPMLQFYLNRPMSLSAFRQFIRPVLPVIYYQMTFFPEGRRTVDMDSLTDLCYIPVRHTFPFHALIFDQDHQESNILLVKSYIEACRRAFDVRMLEVFYQNFCIHLEIQTNNQMKLPDTLFAENIEMFQKWIYNRIEDCIRLLSNGVSREFSAPVETAVRYMLQHYTDPDVSSAEIANAAALSVNRLGVLIKQETGKTINEYLAHIRIEKAVEFLEKTNLKIYEISERCGYKSSQYFSQVFLQKTGRKPIDYRKGKRS